MASPIPASKKDDPEDVSWALTTAESQWARGDHAEALKWLRRAAEAASEAEADMRALELAKAAAEVATQVSAAKAARKSVPPAPAARKSIPPAAPAARKSIPPAVPAPDRPKGASPMGVPTKPAFMPVKPAAAKPAAAKVSAPVAPKPVVAKTTPGPKDPKPEAPKAEPKEKEALDGRKTARRSYAGEVQRGRGPNDESTQTSDTVIEKIDDAAREPMPTKPPAPAATNVDPDSWPTEALPGDALPVPTFEAERTRIGAMAYRADRTDENQAQRTMQAVRVMLYRGADGALRVAPAGSNVSAVAIEAMLVSLDPDVDLPSWLKVD
jgi:hypothetical protein